MKFGKCSIGATYGYYGYYCDRLPIIAESPEPCIDSLSGMHVYYANTDNQFTQVIDLHEKPSKIERHLVELQTYNWVDSGTRGLVVEFFVFSPELNPDKGPTFNHFTANIEFFTNGRVYGGRSQGSPMLIRITVLNQRSDVLKHFQYDLNPVHE